MARLQCPRCGTLVDEKPGQTPTCSKCGFSGGAPSQPAYGAPAPAPSASPYGTAPGSGQQGSQPYGTAPPAGGAPGGFGAPAPGYAPQPRTNGMAVASLVLSLVGMCTYGLTAILGIIFGFIGRNQCRQRNERGEGMALAGIIIGFVMVGLGLLALLWFIFFTFPWWLFV